MIYLPRHFDEPDLVALHALMRDAPFATLISVLDGEPQITHLPVLCDSSRGPYGTLSGHLARANPHWRALSQGQHLVVFQGPHRYISPSWYQHHPSVPTWNYAVVHARGSCRLTEDAAALHKLTAAMTAHFERANGTTWTLPSDPDYLDKQFAHIVGFELTIGTLQGKFKLSQNRPGEDRELVRAALHASGDVRDQELLALMTPPAPPAR